MKLLALITAFAIVSLPYVAEAKETGKSWKHHHHGHLQKGKAIGWNGQGKGLHKGHDAPLPLAAGLPALLMVGAAAIAARRRGQEV